jgi:hypothetical protein
MIFVNGDMSFHTILILFERKKWTANRQISFAGLLAVQYAIPFQNQHALQRLLTYWVRVTRRRHAINE